ncbi:MAG: hypothetical protein V7772_04750 [Pseudomonas profundi]|uniref:hypothetical protein n=1 Tax=Pseudomonas profundi TaxID=1981513 RepID=UPI0030034C60
MTDKNKLKPCAWPRCNGLTFGRYCFHHQPLATASCAEPEEKRSDTRYLDDRSS